MVNKEDRRCMACGTIDGRIISSTKFGGMLCDKHYSQKFIHGKILDRTKYDPNEFAVVDDTLQITMYSADLSIAGVALVNVIHYKKVTPYKWHINGLGYVASYINGETILLHRFITGAPQGSVVDHRNHDKLDNLDNNLRVCSQQENSFNYSGNARNTSGHTGVYWNKQNKRWIAQIKIGNKCKYLGSFIDIQDAINLRHKIALNYFGEFSYLCTDDDNATSVRQGGTGSTSD